MRLGYYITHFPYVGEGTPSTHDYACGGAEWAAYHLAVEIAQRGHEVKVFTASAGHKDDIEYHRGVAVYRYGTSFSVESSSVSMGMLRKPSEHSLDVVHAHFTVPPASYAALWHARRKKTPLIVTYHSEQRAGYGSLVRRVGAMVDNLLVRHSLLPNATSIISPSQHYVDESPFLREHKHKVVSIPNGVNLEDFEIPYTKEECRQRLGLPEDARIVLFMGSLSPQKAPDVLVKALPAVVQSIPNVILLVVGTGAMRQKLEQLARDLDICRSVTFAGLAEYRSRSLYYKASDVFVLPSIEETFGIVLLEASASCLPMVVSDLPTFRWIIKDGYNGVVVKKGDQSDLARALIRLFSDDQLRTGLGQNARGRVGDYSWPAVAEETERLYLAVLKAS
ncbi:MAG: glycosyltransferase family 4 protein [Dehalococcoidia bacterium]|nr:glycosyltransferase family 4 protein [Dehalococcoidia bacterium]